MTSDVLEQFLRQPHIAVLATLRSDGRPYTVPIWWLWKDGAFWLTGTTSRVWCRQLQRDPRASLCIEALQPVAGHVGVDGNVEAKLLPDFDIWPISRQLVDKYVPDDPDALFANMRTEPRLLFRLTPEVWRAIDMRVYEGKRADRDHQTRNEGSRDAVPGGEPTLDR
jgi:PPOX class probable F420-dependent enzyme